MSLAWRILLLVLALNVAVVGTVQVVVQVSQQDWFRRQQSQFLDAALGSFLRRVYTAERLADATQTRYLVQSRLIRELFDDVIVTSGQPPFTLVYLNPRGAVHRDQEQFPRDAILDGMKQARNGAGLVPAAGGFCYAVRKDADVVGTLWYRPKGEAPTTLPIWAALLGTAVGTALFGILVFWIMRQQVGRPLSRLGEAAGQVGAGRYDVRAPELKELPELAALIRSFNVMAARVEGHTGELEHSVRQAVERTKQQEQALVLSSRLAAIGTLAAGIAHEINNPIGGMQNAVHRLLAGSDLTDKQRTYLLLVQDGLQRVARTAHKVLDFSPKNIEARAFPLAVAIDGARALVEHRLSHENVELAVSLPPDLPPLYGDVHEIQQVLLNLLLNSLDAIGARGRGRISIRAHAEAGKVHVLVDDDGPGMEPADLGRVMDPFFSQKDRPDASGLGMFICYSIVRNHGGDIALSTEPGKGFSVHITLPMAAAS